MSFLDDYEPVEDRLRQFWTDHPYGRVITTLEHHVDGDYIVRAEVFIGNELRNDPPTATGYAHDSAAQLPQNMKASALEVCETSAIGRALANMGYAPKGKRPSREEMTKASAPVTSTPPKSEPVAQGPDRGTGADPSGPASPVDHSEAGTASDADSVPLGGAGAESATLEGTDALATDDQWHNILKLAKGKTAVAAKMINDANGTHYTYPAAREGATWAELVKAMGGDA